MTVWYSLLTFLLTYLFNFYCLV